MTEKSLGKHSDPREQLGIHSEATRKPTHHMCLLAFGPTANPDTLANNTGIGDIYTCTCTEDTAMEASGETRASSRGPPTEEEEVLAWAKAVLEPMASEIVELFGWAYREKCRGWAGDLRKELMPRAPFAVVLCTTTYKRTHQLLQAFPVGLCRALHKRRSVFWALADFNQSDEVQDFVAELSMTLRIGFVKYVRPVKAWKTWHCSVAKNTAHKATASGNAFAPPRPPKRRRQA